jgi:2,4-dienoyl-CoA reductase (NADPH2)
VRVTVLHHTTGAVAESRHDWVVCAVAPEPEDGLWLELRGGGLPVHRVGDCLAPRRVHSAVVEGHRVGASL